MGFFESSSSLRNYPCMINFVFFAFNPPEAFSCGAGSLQSKKAGVWWRGSPPICSASESLMINFVCFALTPPLKRFRFRVERGVCSLNEAGVGGA